MAETHPTSVREHAVNVLKDSLCIPSNVSLDPAFHTHRSLSRGQHVYRQNDPSTDVYFLFGGALKAYRVNGNGEEDVVRFYHPLELIWTDGIGGGRRTMSLVSIEESRICTMSLKALQDLMSQYPSVQVRCYELLSRLISEEQALISVLCRGSAERRLAFLLQQLGRHRLMSESRERGYTIPMARCDIANYLGLRVETVSRAFGKLEERRVVEVHGRRVNIVDPAMLESLASGGSVDYASG